MYSSNSYVNTRNTKTTVSPGGMIPETGMRPDDTGMGSDTGKKEAARWQRFIRVQQN